MRSRERGSGTILAIGFGAVVVVGGLLATTLAAVVAATHRADAAADLAALSAARLVHESADSACSRARSIAAANQAQLVNCAATHQTVDVVVRVRTGRLLGTVLTIRARARAGPSTIEGRREGATRRADRTRERRQAGSLFSDSQKQRREDLAR